MTPAAPSQQTVQGLPFAADMWAVSETCATEPDGRVSFHKRRLNGSRWRDGRFAYVNGRVHVLAETALPCSATGCRIMSVLRRSSPSAWWNSRIKAVRKYQNTNQNTYQPRPSQTPAAPFKRLYPN